MKKILLTVLIFAMLLALATGCSKAGNSEVEKDTSPEETTSVVAEDAEELGWPRTITDARGVEVTIGKKPEGFAATSWNITEHLLALDTPPIIAKTVDTFQEWASTKEYMKKYTIEELGHPTNFEKLAELKPEFIIATTWNKDDYDKYEQIAPTFVLDGEVLFDDWRTAMGQIASVLGKEKEAEKFIADTKTNIDQSREGFAGISETVGFIRGGESGISSMGPTQLAVYYDDEVGLGLPLPEGWIDEYAEISLEGLSELDPDILFIASDDFERFIAEMNKKSVWKTMKAIKNGKVYPIDLSGLTGGPLATKYGVKTILEVLER